MLSSCWRCPTPSTWGLRCPIASCRLRTFPMLTSHDSEEYQHHAPTHTEDVGHGLPPPDQRGAGYCSGISRLGMKMAATASSWGMWNGMRGLPQLSSARPPRRWGHTR
jgi:hypothetical protein